MGLVPGFMKGEQGKEEKVQGISAESQKKGAPLGALIMADSSRV